MAALKTSLTDATAAWLENVWHQRVILEWYKQKKSQAQGQASKGHEESFQSCFCEESLQDWLFDEQDDCVDGIHQRLGPLPDHFCCNVGINFFPKHVGGM